MISIKKPEADRIAEGTVPNVAVPEEFVVLPEVLHHLHCLVGTLPFFSSWTKKLIMIIAAENVSRLDVARLRADAAIYAGSYG